MRWLLIGLLLAGCGNGETAPAGPTPCTATVDCPPGQICTSGPDTLCPGSDAECTCRVIGCETTADCNPPRVCTKEGTCLPPEELECLADADCCAGGGECARICDQHVCVCTAAAVCQQGDVEECFVECHRGQRACVDCDWGACDAPPVTDEVCGDGVDNDCDAQTDEAPECAVCEPNNSQACLGDCGYGKQTCLEDGTWGPCESAEDCGCEAGESHEQPCGDCGAKTRNCTPDGEWGEYGPCLGELGEEQTRACGNCGEQARTCAADGLYGEWGICTGEGECAPEQEQLDGCEGVCGTRTRTCDDACAWGEWSACDESGGGCGVGEEQTQDCGQCGVQVAVCDDECQWGEFGECEEPLGAECDAGTFESEDCGQCGTRTRTCDEDDCQWSPWSLCESEGECAPGTVEEQSCGVSDEGECQLGTQVRTCDAACAFSPWGPCLGEIPPATEICGSGKDEDCDGESLLEPDDWEPNDTCLSCAELGEDPDLIIEPSFDNAGDTVDFFCFEALDSANPRENIIVELTQQQGGVDADLYLYDGYVKCDAGEAEKFDVGFNEDKSIHWNETVLSDDGGTWIIEVRNFGAASCGATYQLSVKGLL